MITLERFNVLLKRYPRIKGFTLGPNQVKIAAGWLLQYLGYRGKRSGNFGCYEKQALILVNHQTELETNTGEYLIPYINQIKQAVFNEFALKLEVEPNLVSQKTVADWPNA